MRTLKSRAAALGIVFSALVVSTPALALEVLHTESGDAGQLLETAQKIGAATFVDGVMADPSGAPITSDVDMYEVCLTGGQTFSASTHPDDGGQSTGFNPALSLFDSEGRGVYFNNNFVSDSADARLPAGHTLTPVASGKYYLSVTQYGNFALDEAGSFQLDLLPFGIGGPLTSAPLGGWTVGGEMDSGATYRIALTGVTPCTTPPVFTVSDFLPPINSGAVNKAKAGGVIPVKWLLTDADGNPVSDPSSFVSITTDPGGGICEGISSVTVETWPGNSGLRYLGDGVWQFNWKVPKSYANQCRLMTLTLSDGTEASAIFEFK